MTTNKKASTIMPNASTNSISRRRFLTLGSASILVSGAASTLRAASGPWGGFRMGAQSYCFRNFTLDETVRRMSALGLHYIELFPGHADHNKLSLSEAAALRKRLEDDGITVDGYGVTGFSKDEAAARKVFDFAKAMGMRSISADPSPDSFDLLDKLVAEYEIPVAIHNHGPHHKWGKPEVILEAVKDHHEKIGLCCDSGHFLRAEVDPVEACRILKGRVFGLHVKDFVGEHEERIVGEGRLDLAALFREMRTQNFNGTCSLEYELEADNPDAGIAKGLSNCRAAIASLA